MGTLLLKLLDLEATAGKSRDTESSTGEGTGRKLLKESMKLQC